jgi:hypothetical protein
VSVPWVTTMPSTSACLASAATRLAEREQVFVGEALGGDLEDLLAADLGDLTQSRDAGDQLVHRHLGGLVGGALGGIGAGAGDGAAGGQDDDVGFVGKSRKGREAGGSDQRAAGKEC